MAKEPYSVERAAELYERHSLSEVADRLGVRPWRVRRDLKARPDVSLRPQGRIRTLPVPSETTLRELRVVERLSQGKIAKRMRVSKHTVQNWLEIRGLK